MVIALGDIYAQIQRREEAREVMGATHARVREHPGRASFWFAASLADPGHFVVVEHWREQAALDDHYRSQTFADYQAQIGQLLVRSSDLRVHTVEASARPVTAAAIDISQEE